MKIRQVGAELFHADRLTDMTMLTVAFRNFANAPEIEHLYQTNQQRVRHATYLTLVKHHPILGMYSISQAHAHKNGNC
jgi:hypothetical protein